MNKKISDILEKISLDKVPIGTVPYVEIGDVNVDTKEISIKNKPSVSGAVMCPPESVIISKVRPSRGAIAYIENEIAVTSAFTILKTDKSKCLPKFLFYYLAWNEPFYSFLQSRSTGVTYPTVKEKEILNYSIPYLPSINEQEKIVSRFEEVEALRKKRLLVDIKTTEFIESVFFDMFGNLEKNSKKWHLIRLGENNLAEFRYGTSAKCNYDSNGVPVLRIPNILGESINTEDLKFGNISVEEATRLTLESGDLLFVRTNGNPEYVGRSAVFDMPGKYLFASYLIRARLDRKQINPWFLSAFLRTNFGKQSLAPVIRTTAGQSNLSVEGIKSIKIPLPPIELQNKFAEIFKMTYELKKKQKTSSAKIKSVTLSLADQTFFGFKV